MLLIQILGKFSFSDVLGNMQITFASSFGVVFFISGTIFHL